LQQDELEVVLSIFINKLKKNKKKKFFLTGARGCGVV